MSRISQTKIAGPQGELEVSTIQTFAGGAPVTQPLGSPFSTADYADQTPWPFETMVFRPTGSTGLYHRAYATEVEAKKGHEETVELCRTGTLPVGHGVDGEFGNPTLTAAEWAAIAQAEGEHPPARTP